MKTPAAQEKRRAEGWCSDSESGGMQPVAPLSDQKRFPEWETGGPGRSLHATPRLAREAVRLGIFVTHKRS